MGMFDVVEIKCPVCMHRNEVQTKAGPCILRTYNIYDAPPDVLAGVANKIYTCESNVCEQQFFVTLKVEVQIQTAGMRWQDAEDGR